MSKDNSPIFSDPTEYQKVLETYGSLLAGPDPKAKPKKKKKKAAESVITTMALYEKMKERRRARQQGNCGCDDNSEV